MDFNLTASNSDHMKQINRSVVLNIIRKHGPISKVEISEKTKLTFATIANIIAELTKSNLIIKNGLGESKGGRKPVLYQLNVNASFVIGVELGISKISTIITDLNASIISKYSVETLSTSGSTVVVNQIYDAIDEVIRISEVDRDKLIGIGVSTPGPVDLKTGVVMEPPNLTGWEHVPLKELISTRYKLPTFIEKDANAAALGEKWFGAAIGKENVIFVLVDEGIGGGIIYQGRIYRGYNYGGGDIGHGTIDINGPKCNCGNYGCLETLASGIAIVKKVREALEAGEKSVLENTGEKITLASVIMAANNDDLLAKRILEEAGTYIGVGIASLINFFNPEVIIIGGSVVNNYESIISTIDTISRERAFSFYINNGVSIEQSFLGERAGLIGAVSLVLEYCFDHPNEMIFSN